MKMSHRWKCSTGLWDVGGVTHLASRAVSVHSGIITRRLSEINMVISSGQNTMYNTHPTASPSTVSFSNHFHPHLLSLSPFLHPSNPLPRSLAHSAFLRLPTSATHLQITAALVIRPVISCNSFFFSLSSLPVDREGRESEPQEWQEPQEW